VEIVRSIGEKALFVSQRGSAKIEAEAMKRLPKAVNALARTQKAAKAAREKFRPRRVARTLLEHTEFMDPGFGEMEVHMGQKYYAKALAARARLESALKPKRSAPR
jgi:hypothetical protein